MSNPFYVKRSAKKRPDSVPKKGKHAVVGWCENAVFTGKLLVMDARDIKYACGKQCLHCNKFERF